MKVRSGFEARVMEAARAHTDMEYEPDTFVYVIEHKYTPDIKLPNGIYIECKGRFLGKDRTKHLAMRKQHPDKDIRIVFQRDEPLVNRRSKKRYSDWCNDNNIQWAIGEIPLEWIKEKGNGTDD